MDDTLILIVDDSSFMRTVLRVAMQSQGYVVREASDGNQAVAALNDTVPALLISDYDMPGLDGLQLLNQIRKDTRMRELPVIFLSARNNADLKAKARQGGAAWVEKPFQTADFLNLVRETIRPEIVPE